MQLACRRSGRQRSRRHVASGNRESCSRIEDDCLQKRQRSEGCSDPDVSQQQRDHASYRTAMKQTTDIREFADLSPAVRTFISRTQKLYIDGQWVPAASGKTLDTIDPATEQVICEVAEGGRDD